jgi:hypothetical protein
MTRPGFKKPLHAIGFWGSQGCYLCFPHPRELIDASWDPAERRAVADYLARGVSLRGYLGYSFCRFPDGPPDDEMGTDDFTDGQWVWPQALALYVLRYSVRLPEDFLASARGGGDRIPSHLDVGPLRSRRYSYKRWVRWVRRNRSNRLLAMLSLPCAFIP